MVEFPIEMSRTNIYKSIYEFFYKVQFFFSIVSTESISADIFASGIKYSFMVTLHHVYGDVSEWVKFSMGRKSPNNQTNLQFIQWINVIRFLFPHCELSRVSFPVWKEQTIVAPGAGELKTQLSPLGKMHFHYVTIISR